MSTQGCDKSERTNGRQNRLETCLLQSTALGSTYFPVRPSHNLTALSKPALAIHRPSGENATWLTCFWCPVSRAIGFLGFSDASGDHKNSVWSSEPVIINSGLADVNFLYRARARDCAVDVPKRISAPASATAAAVA